MEYYYLDKETPKGPFSLEQLLALYQSKQITAETLVSSPGEKSWMPLKFKLQITSDSPCPRPSAFSNITTPAGLSIWQCYKRCFHYYATFSGRATRKEYWSFTLINFAICIGYVGVVVVLKLSHQEERHTLDDMPIDLKIAMVIAIWAAMAIVIPTLAVGVRRLHDAGFSGWFYFLNCIPYVGGIIGLVFFLLDSTRGDNAYGPSCKYPQNNIKQ